MNIAVVDTGGANLRSVTNALTRLGAEWRLTSDPALIKAADKVLLPGVGAAADTMAKLNHAHLVPVLQGLTQPILGICLGMQLLFSSSAEGDVAGLGLIPGRVTRLTADQAVRIPHMGWNQLTRRLEDPLLQGITADDYVYFVHSYRAPDGPWVTAWTEHGGEVPAVVRWQHVHGVQFHPEKSQTAGARILENFLKL